MHKDRWLGYLLIALGIALAANSLLGPLALGVIEYHLSVTLINQGIGLDAFSLAIVAPLLIGAGVMLLRGQTAAVVIAIAPALYLPYMFLQYIAGPEYLQYEGNNESFFPLHVALFSLGAFAGLRAWSLLPATAIAPMTRRGERIAGAAVLAVAVFIAFGMYLGNGFIGALSDFQAWVSEPGVNRREYLDNPHMYWTVVLLDLGVAVPAITATAIALLRGGTTWAVKAMYVVVGWLALVGPAVAAMAIVMELNDDPNASLGKAIMFCVAAAFFLVFALRLYWPILNLPNPTLIMRMVASAGWPGRSGGRSDEITCHLRFPLSRH
jgi:hypothetical protein